MTPKPKPKPKPKPETPCPDCAGRGLWSFATEEGICKTCDGTGTVK
jgi:DnaJ-class molecular chaperone